MQSVNELTLFAAFLIGLLGSTHCIGMCGGIVGALTMGLPVQVRRSPVKLLPFLLTYNTGRLISYSLAGLLAGSLTDLVSDVFQTGRYPVGGIVGGLFMVALGVYIGGWFQTLAPLEKAGAVLWRKIEPFGRYFLPISSPVQAIGLGFFWGWLPCGMVYSTLAWAASAGNAIQAALLMLAFGVGTLPMLLVMGGFADKLQSFTRNKWIRYMAGLLLIAFGLILLGKVLGGGARHQLMHQGYFPLHEITEVVVG